MKKVTILFLLLCFLTVAFSGVAFAATADNSQSIEIGSIKQDHPSFWVKHRYTIFGIIAGVAIYNHNHHHHDGGSVASAPVIN